MRKITKLFSILLTALGLTAGSVHADILGAGIGGLIGSQFGSGDGKLAMTAIGAVIGDRMTQTQMQVMPQQTYGYAPPPVAYGYQNAPGNYYEPSYQYAPAPIVVRVPRPVYYQNNNYAYNRERSWGRNYGYENRRYGHGYDRRERHYH
jgi:hypothetical protein